MLDKRKIDLNFDKALQIGALDSGTVFQIKEFEVYDTKYGTMLVIEDVEGQQYYSYSEVIVPKFVKSINTGVKLHKAVVKFEEVESGHLDEETGEYGVYHNITRASSQEASEYQLELSNKRKEAKVKRKAEQDSEEN